MARQQDAGTPGPGYTCFGSSNVPSSRPIAAWAPGTPVTTFPSDTGLRLLAGRSVVMQVHYNLTAGPLPDRTTIELALTPNIPKEAFVVMLADLAMVVEPGLESAEATFEIDLASVGLSLGVFIRGVFPHMHELGSTMRVEVVHEEQPMCAAHVPRWDFQWQRFYFYEEPLYVFPSDRLRVSCTYDTRSRTEPVRWGEGTADEMCLVGLYLTPF